MSENTWSETDEYVLRNGVPPDVACPACSEGVMGWTGLRGMRECSSCSWRLRSAPEPVLPLEAREILRDLGLLPEDPDDLEAPEGS